MTKDDKAISAKSHKKSDPKKRRRRRVETFNSYIYKVRAAPLCECECPGLDAPTRRAHQWFGCSMFPTRMIFSRSQVLKQVHPETGISKRAMSIMNSFVNDTFDRMAEEAVRLSRTNQKRTLTSREIQTSVRLILPGELAKVRTGVVSVGMGRMHVVVAAVGVHGSCAAVHKCGLHSSSGAARAMPAEMLTFGSTRCCSCIICLTTARRV